MHPDYVCFNLGLALRRVTRVYEQVMARYGLTPGQFFALGVLARQDGLKFKELAERLSIEGPTLTGTLDRLERAGFVERRDDPDDRRSLRVWMTEKGRGVRAETDVIARELDARIRSAFTEDQFAQFTNVLSALQSLPDHLVWRTTSSSNDPRTRMPIGDAS